MARISLGLCFMLVIASSVIYEVQGTFLLRQFLRKIPGRCNEFTPYASQGIITFATNLEGSCPPTPEFKTFFTEFKSYIVFIEKAPTSSKNIDAELQTKCDGLFKSMSKLSSGKGGKSEDAGGMKVTLMSMGKTLIELKKNTMVLTLEKKKELIMSMVKWTKSIATFLKGASEKKGKTINITTYQLDVDVNDKSILGGSTTETGSSSTKTGSVSGKGSSDGAFKDTTGSSSTSGSPIASPSGSPMASPSGSKSVTGSASATGGGAATKTSSDQSSASVTRGGAATKASSDQSSASVTGGGAATKTSSDQSSASVTGGGATKTSSAGETQTSSSSSSSAESAKQFEMGISKSIMIFITGLEKKHSTTEELKMFFAKLKATMLTLASSSVVTKSPKDYVSASSAATGKISEAATLVSSRNVKSAKMKSNMETTKSEMMDCLKELQNINSKIASSKAVTATQQTEIREAITKWQQVTTQFVQTASSSSKSSSYSSLSSSSTTAKPQRVAPHVMNT